jgi:hypothetical protein
MDQIPATPAKVTYQGGLLTIAAQNSPLSEILRDVHKLTGAAIEIPPRTTGAEERVIAHLGPGTPRDVLVALLNGSSFNYVMLGSNSDPSVISNIILTSKSGPGGDAQTAAAMQNAPPPGVVMPPHPMPPQQAFNPQAGAAQPDNPEGEAPPEEEQQQDPAADENANADEQAQPEQAQPDPSQPEPGQPNAGPKTPEQILEMLRRQQQPGAVAPPPQGQEQPPEQQ